ncbi:MAG TPA: hypothetical protein VIJ23_14160 [Mycobacterium sp.]
MDHKNLFMTPTTYRLVRLEYGMGLLVCIALALLHFSEIRWIAFIALFAVIDLVGYIPGRIVWSRHDHMVPRPYYVLYNVAHHLGTSAVLAGLWCVVIGPEWALLALPIHLLGDRALFGNLLKPFGLPFEPEALPSYTAFSRSYLDGHLAVAAVPSHVPASAAAHAGITGDGISSGISAAASSGTAG